MAIKLRPASLDDADLLLAWRNDLQTRLSSHNTREIGREEHLAWLAETVSNPSRLLMVAEEGGVPVGTVRADREDGVYELSWTVSPDARGRGVGKRMVALFASQISGPVRAEVKPGNTASIRIMEYAGLQFDREENGVLHYRRGA